MVLITVALTCSALIPVVQAADDPVNYDDPNLARTDEFANDQAESKLVGPDLKKIVKVLVDGSNRGEENVRKSTVR
jgi:hypothetical protein